MNQDLLDYIKQQTDEGWTVQAIKAELVGLGWLESEVDQALAASPPPVSVAPPPAAAAPPAEAPAKPAATDKPAAKPAASPHPPKPRHMQSGQEMALQAQYRRQAISHLAGLVIMVIVLGAIAIGSYQAYRYSLDRTTVVVSTNCYKVSIPKSYQANTEACTLNAVKKDLRGAVVATISVSPSEQYYSSPEAIETALKQETVEGASSYERIDLNNQPAFRVTDDNGTSLMLYSPKTYNDTQGQISAFIVVTSGPAAGSASLDDLAESLSFK